MAMLTIEKIEPNQFNPNVMSSEAYAALLEDMRVNGIDAVDDIIVSTKPIFYGDPSLPSDEYVIVDGYHRWKAAKELESNVIHARILSMTEAQAKAVNYRKNRERGTMDPFKEGQLFADEAASMTQEAIGEKYGVDRSYISRRIALVGIQSEVGEAVEVRRQEIKVEIERLRGIPCESCANESTCSRDLFHVDDTGENLVCESYVAGGEDENEDINNLKEELQSLERGVPRGTLTPSHLEEIVVLKTPKRRIEAIGDVIQYGRSVSGTRSRVDRLRREEEQEEQLRQALATSEYTTCPECGSAVGRIHYRGLPWVNCTENYHTWNIETGLTEEAQRKLEHEQFLAENPEIKERERREAAERFLPKSFRHSLTKDEIRAILSRRIISIVPTFETLQFIRVTGQASDGKMMEFDLSSDDGVTMGFAEVVYTKAKESIYARDIEHSVSFRVEPMTWKTDNKNKVKINCDTSDQAKLKAVKDFLDNLAVEFFVEHEGKDE